MDTSDATYRISVSTYALDHKIPSGDAFWPTFNASFANRELSRMDIADAIYTGHPLTTWHRNHWRQGSNFECGQHIGLDFDTKDEHSRLSVLSQDKFLARYAALLHTTTSHTPAEPRARALFLLDIPIHQAANYALAVQALLWLFGTADRQCKDPVRFWYGALRCDMEYMENVLPLVTIKHLIAEYQESGRREHKRIVGTWPTDTAQADVEAALRKIPALQIDYDEWVAILMALHREYGDAGFALADAWAEGVGNEVERKWRGFHADGNVSGAVGLGTVFAIAKRFGWQRPL
jgi:hypothetical protein